MMEIISRAVERARRLFKCKQGAAAVEAAFALPVLLLALLGMLEMGRLGWTQSALNFAVQEAARCAAVNVVNCGTSAATADFAAQRARGANVPPAAFTLTSEACGKQVTARHDYRLILYPIFQASPTLTSRFCRA